MDLSKIENQYAFTFESGNLGRIRMWPAYSCAALSELRKGLTPYKKKSSIEFMLFFLSLSAAPENPKKPRHKEELLTKEQLTALSDDELHSIAGGILDHHSYLFVDRTGFEKVESGDADTVRLRVKSKQVDLQRGEGEDNIEYLRRVVEAYVERQDAMIRKMSDDISGSLSKMISQSTAALAGLNTGLADRIDHTLDTIRGSYDPGLNTKMMLSQAILPPPNPQHKTNDLLADIMDTLSGQKPFNAEMVRAIQALNERAEKSEADNKALAKKSNRQMWISIVIGFIAAIATIAGAVIAYWGYKALLPQ